MIQQKYILAQLVKTVKRFENENFIKNKVAKRFMIHDPGTLGFYKNPKLHKEGITGRRGFRSINYHVSKISEYVDSHQQSIVRLIHHCIEGTGDFLSKLKNITELPEKSFLLTLYITHICIKRSEAEKAVILFH